MSDAQERKGRRVKKGKWVNASEGRRAEELAFEKREGQATPSRSTTARLITTLCIIGALVGGGLYFHKITHSASPTGTAEKTVSPPEVPEFLSEPIEWSGELPRQTLKRFKEAETVEEKLSCFDHLGVVEERAREFFTTGPGSREKIINLIPKRKNHVQGELYLIFLAAMEDGTVRPVCLRHLPEGPKIDFDSYAAYGSESWEDLATGRVTGAKEVRLILKKIHFYQGAFADEEHWQSFEGSLLDQEKPLYLYFARQESEFKKLDSVISSRNLRVNVALKAPENAKPGQFQITQINSPNWISGWEAIDH